MSDFIEESESELDKDIARFTLEEIDKIWNIVNHLILTDNSNEPFTVDDIKHIVHANKYTNLFFSYALLTIEHIESDGEQYVKEIVGGGRRNATLLFILFLVLFNTVFVDAGLLKGRQSVLRFTPFKTIPDGRSGKKLSQATIELAKRVVKLSSTLRDYTPPLLTDVTNISTMTTHTATITAMTLQKQIQHIYIYIIQNILLRKIKGSIKKQITIFIHSCFIKEIAPLFFPQLQPSAIQFADVILWCIQNKIPETFNWSKKMMKNLLDFSEIEVLTHITHGGKQSIKKNAQKKRSFIRSKKNIKHRKKNTKVTMKKTMMNRMMIPKKFGM
jgi:hypothetical protein